MNTSRANKTNWVRSFLRWLLSTSNWGRLNKFHHKRSKCQLDSQAFLFGKAEFPVSYVYIYIYIAFGWRYVYVPCVPEKTKIRGFCDTKRWAKFNSWGELGHDFHIFTDNHLGIEICYLMPNNFTYIAVHSSSICNWRSIHLSKYHLNQPLMFRGHSFVFQGVFPSSWHGFESATSRSFTSWLERSTQLVTLRGCPRRFGCST